MVQGDRVQPTDWLDPDQNGASMLRFRLWKELLVASKTRRVLQKTRGELLSAVPAERQKATVRKHDRSAGSADARARFRKR